VWPVVVGAVPLEGEAVRLGRKKGVKEAWCSEFVKGYWFGLEGLDIHVQLVLIQISILLCFLRF